MKKSIPRGLIYPQTVKIIERNGGEVGPQEIRLCYIQQERPYLNTGATIVIFKSGEYIYYNERGTWNDVSPTMTSGITRFLAATLRPDENSETINIWAKIGASSAVDSQYPRGPPDQYGAAHPVSNRPEVRV